MAKKLFVLLAVSTILMAPIIALSAPLNVGTAPAVTGNAISICFFANIIGKILDILWILFITFAITMFIVAGFLFLKAHGEVAEVATARKALLWGVVGVIVAVSAFMLPYFIKNTLVGGNNAANICAPANNNGDGEDEDFGDDGNVGGGGAGGGGDNDGNAGGAGGGGDGDNAGAGGGGAGGGGDDNGNAGGGAGGGGDDDNNAQCIPACNAEAGSVCINGRCTVQGF